MTTIYVNKIKYFKVGENADFTEPNTIKGFYMGSSFGGIATEEQLIYPLSKVNISTVSDGNTIDDNIEFPPGFLSEFVRYSSKNKLFEVYIRNFYKQTQGFEIIKVIMCKVK